VGVTPDKQAPRITAGQVVELEGFCLVAGSTRVKAVVHYDLPHLEAPTFGLLVGDPLPVGEFTMVQVRIDKVTESPWDTTGIGNTEVVVMVSHEDDTTALFRQDFSDLLEKQARLVILLPEGMSVLAGVHGSSGGVKEITQVTEVGDILRFTVEDSEKPVDS
jgi:hypothetical protein